MFTGIVEELGIVRALRLLPESGQLTLEGKRFLMEPELETALLSMEFA